VEENHSSIQACKRNQANIIQQYASCVVPLQHASYFFAANQPFMKHIIVLLLTIKYAEIADRPFVNIFFLKILMYIYSRAKIGNQYLVCTIVGQR